MGCGVSKPRPPQVAPAEGKPATADVAVQLDPAPPGGDAGLPAAQSRGEPMHSPGASVDQRYASSDIVVVDAAGAEPQGNRHGRHSDAQRMLVVQRRSETPGSAKLLAERRLSAGGPRRNLAASPGRASPTRVRRLGLSTEKARHVFRILSSYVPKDVVAHYKETAGARLDQHLCKPVWGAVVLADMSGFTKLTESLAKKGPAGAELISKYLNQFFSRMVDVVHRHGGDVIRFLGDALLLLWQIPRESDDSYKTLATMRAAQCALAIRAELDFFPVENLMLRVHSIVCAGDLEILHLGNPGSRLEYLLNGLIFEQMRVAADHSEVGTVVASPPAAAHLDGKATLEPLPDTDTLLLTAVEEAGEADARRLRAATVTVPAPSEVVDVAEALARYVQPIVRERIMAGIDVAELRQLSIAFIALPAHPPVALQQEVLEVILAAVEKHRGILRQFVSDDKGCVAILVFGLVQTENRGRSALMACCQIQDASSVPLSIGVASGNVFTGGVGSPESRQEFAVIGDPVNTSARLMGQAIKAEGPAIMCDERTVALLSSARRTAAPVTIKTTKHGEIKLKGKERLVPVFRCTFESTLQAMSSGLKQEQSIAHRVFGRDSETKLVEDAAESIKQQGQSWLVTVMGDPGSGKSAFTHHAIKCLENIDFFSIVTGNEDAERNSALYSIRNFMQACVETLMECGVTTMAGSDELVDLQPIMSDRPILATLLPDILPAVALAKVRSLDGGSMASLKPLEGQARVAAIKELVVLIVQRVKQAVETPKEDPDGEDHEDRQRGRRSSGKKDGESLLVAVEDYQWMDALSRDVLEAILASVEGILVVVNTRKFESSQGANEHGFKKLQKLVGSRSTAIMLGPLGSLAAEGIMCSLIDGATRANKELVDLLMTKTSGIPLFVRHSFESLIDDELVYADDTGEVRCTDLDEASESLGSGQDMMTDIMLGRISLLPAQVQLVLKALATVGMEIDSSLIVSVMMLPEIASDMEPPTMIKALLNSDMMVPATQKRVGHHSNVAFVVDGETGQRYRFSHALVRNAAYSLLLFKDRARLHRKTALWHEEYYAERPELIRMHPVIAGHWHDAAKADAVVDSKLQAYRGAIHHFRLAATEASRVYALADALALCQQGCAIINEARACIAEEAPQPDLSPWARGLLSMLDVDELDLLVLAGPAMMIVKGWKDSIEIYKTAYELCQKESCRGSQYAFRTMIGLWLGSISLNRSHSDLLPLTVNACETAKLHKDPDGVVKIESNHLYGTELLLCGMYVKAHEELKYGVDHYDRKCHHQPGKFLGHDPGVCCNVMCGTTSYTAGDYPSGLALCERSLEIANMLPHPPSLIHAYMQVSRTMALLGRWDRVAELFAASEAAVSVGGSPVSKQIVAMTGNTANAILLAKSSEPGAREKMAEHVEKVAEIQDKVRHTMLWTMFSAMSVLPCYTETGSTERGLFEARYWHSLVKQDPFTLYMYPSAFLLHGRLILQLGSDVRVHVLRAAVLFLAAVRSALVQEYRPVVIEALARLLELCEGEQDWEAFVGELRAVEFEAADADAFPAPPLEYVPHPDVRTAEPVPLEDLLASRAALEQTARETAAAMRAFGDAPPWVYGFADF